MNHRVWSGDAGHHSVLGSVGMYNPNNPLQGDHEASREVSGDGHDVDSAQEAHTVTRP